MALQSQSKPSAQDIDAIALLKADHATVKKLLGELDETTARAAKRRGELLAKIAMEVEAHAAIEEEIFYPAFRNQGESKEDEKLFFEAQEEHGLVHKVLPELKETDPSTEVFSARAKVLKDLIEHHAEEEEKELFPRVRSLLSKSDLTEIGGRLQERKSALMEQGGSDKAQKTLRRRNGM